MKMLFRVKHQYEDKWLCDNYYKDDDIYNNFGEYIEDAHIFDSLEEIYELIDDEHLLEVLIETIYCSDMV